MGFKSEYVLRKQKPDGVSTIEALDIIYRFLNKEFSTDKFLSSFRAMQAAQIAKMGDEIFLRHYAKR
jgi:DTW domain-containing protein YfiP